MEVVDRWAALQFDNAVRFIGTVIENAAQETVEAGAGKHKKMVPKYYMDQLLDPSFYLPRPKSSKEQEKGNVRAFVAMAKSMGGVRYKKVSDGTG